MSYNNFYFLVFDIETSKEMCYDEKNDKYMPVKVWLSYGVIKLVTKYGKIVNELRFREWEELRKYFIDISCRFKEKIICFVHNLSYEFDFLIKNIERPKKFLCNNAHGVISSELENFNIEFRCTYQLSKVSLSKLGEMYNIPKLDSEYRTIYPSDEITNDEWKYCSRDCDIIIPYVLDLQKEYGMICRIPLTSTGRVRRKLKEYNNLSTLEGWDLMPPENCYKALCRTFRGATTMSNPRFTNVHIKRRVRSFDEKSKYPSVMLCKEYPYTICKDEKFTQESYKKYKFWIGLVKLTRIRAIYDWGFISTSTCESFKIFDADVFNGKIINCNEVILYITNIDLETFKKVYFIDNIEFLEFYPCKDYAKLPEQFIELIKGYAEAKTLIGNELKTLDEFTKEYDEKHKEYMEAKALLNGIYGMMVQKLVQTEYKIDENYMWHEISKPYKQTFKHLGRNFLYGIFITSYSRYDLVNNIAYNCPYNFVYCDTDSIKFIDMGKDFIDLNEDLPDDLSCYNYLKGFNKFEEETPYEEFITYGAKKYAYIKNGKFGFTVAGLPKSTKIESFNQFKLGTTYKNCKLAKRYIYHQMITDVDIEDNTIIQQFKDYNRDINDNGGIALFETDYTLNMTELDLDYIRRNKSLWEKGNIQLNISI